MATKKQQTFAKMQREQRVREKRQLKAEKKQAAAEAKLAALNAPEGSEAELDEGDTREEADMAASKKSFTAEEARSVGEQIGIDWEDRRRSTSRSSERDGRRAGARPPRPSTNVTGDDPHVTARSRSRT